MVKTSHKTPVTLVTGLLGSGKTSVIQTLLQHKPKHETWALLINEFGHIGIDAALLSNPNLPIVEVSGGCLCCSAQFGYQQALNKLLQKKFDRLLIEPSGLGHPARIIDTLKSSHYADHLKITGIYCVITPQQLTKERWQKSKVMRDLVTLADSLLLNKIDLANADQIKQAQEILQTVYPPKLKIELTSLRQPLQQNIPGLLLSLLDFKLPPQPFYHLQGLDQHQQFTNTAITDLSSKIDGCTQLKAQFGEISSLGWVFNNRVQFNRNHLKNFIENVGDTLLRVKGVIRTGNEWQSVNWVEQQLKLDDIAWREDSRLEMIFSQNIEPQWPEIEMKLSESLNIRN